jgi:hypothetical protein
MAQHGGAPQVVALRNRAVYFLDKSEWGAHVTQKIIPAVPETCHGRPAPSLPRIGTVILAIG